MKGRGVFLLALHLLHILFTGFVAADGDSKEISTPNTGGQTDNLIDTKKSPGLAKGDGEKKDTDQQEWIYLKDKDGLSQQETTPHSFKETKKNVGEGKDKPLEESKTFDDLSKESLVEGSNKKKPRIVDPQIVGCDLSNRCIDKKNNLIACLRVPGTDTQALSLVIQNKGKGSLDVEIIAPSFVNLERSKMQIKAKEDKEVKVYVNEDIVKDSMIILKAGDGNCSLDFRNIMPNAISKSETIIMPTFISTYTGYALLCICFAAAAVIGAAWLCIRLRLLIRQEAGPKYQKLEVGLPVSTGGKKEADGGDDGWEDNWENGWDEEEVPVTPSGTISNPSLKGLASRRFNKDGWKD